MIKREEKEARLIIDYFWGEVKNLYNESKVYDRLVAVDDDVFSAFIAAWYYHEARAKGYRPKIDAIGGYGLMSGKINPRLGGKRLSEAEMLVYTLKRLGVPEEDIDIVCPLGTNTGQNLSAYAVALQNAKHENDKILFCLTKRLAGRFYLTQIKQQPQLQADYVTMNDVFGECSLYNGKSLANCLPWFSEVASIYDRYIRYTSSADEHLQFMKKLDKPLPEDVCQAGEYLCRKFRLKMPESSLLKFWQFAKVYIDFLIYKKSFQTDLDKRITSWQFQLKHRFDLARVYKTDDFFKTEIFLKHA